MFEKQKRVSIDTEGMFKPTVGRPRIDELHQSELTDRCESAKRLRIDQSLDPRRERNVQLIGETNQLRPRM